MLPTTIIAMIGLFIALVSGALMVLSRHKKAGKGEVKLIGELATVETQLSPEGTVIVRGELWRARSRDRALILSHVRVRVVGFEDHLALVEVCD